jgi:hypothetical protein
MFAVRIKDNNNVPISAVKVRQSVQTATCSAVKHKRNNIATQTRSVACIILTRYRTAGPIHTTNHSGNGNFPTHSYHSLDPIKKRSGIRPQSSVGRANAGIGSC